jgi:hypothetical protein
VYFEITPLKFLCRNTYIIMTTTLKKLSQTQFTIKLKLNNDKLQSNNTDIDPYIFEVKFVIFSKKLLCKVRNFLLIV